MNIDQIKRSHRAYMARTGKNISLKAYARDMSNLDEVAEQRVSAMDVIRQGHKNANKPTSQAKKDRTRAAAMASRVKKAK